MSLARKRLTKDDRRAQLLEVARAIVRLEGTEALTLGHLAERAGVTKPITYTHFGDREGLLIALYKAYDDRQCQALRASLAESGKTLEAVVQIYSRLYIACAMSEGPEVGPVIDALSGTQALRAFLIECRVAYGEILRTALAPFIDLKGVRAEAAMTAIIGVADAMAESAATGRLPRTAAEETLSGAIGGILATFAQG